MMGARLSVATGLLLLLVMATAMAACAKNEAAARPQLVVVIDTDAPLTGELTAEFSSALAIDAVRVDIVGEDGTVTDFRDFTVPDPRDWPLSLGAPSIAGGVSRLTLRIRAFRSGAQTTTGTLNGATVLDPEPTSTIDRLATFDLPASGETTARVTLRAACMGQAVSFVEGGTTCTGDANSAGRPSDDIEIGAGTGPTLAGSAEIAREIPCTSPPPSDDAICIPGGVSVLGTNLVRDVDETPDVYPARFVRISPFYLDRTEFTVGRYRTLLNAKRVSDVPRTAFVQTESPTFNASCTYRSSGSQDKLPLSCIPRSTMESACAAVGGRLPTEAEWEHAARGGGEELYYPWGNAPATCCAADLGRVLYSPAFSCTAGDPTVEPVGSHVTPSGCDGLADVTRDGIVDMLGSLREVVNGGGLGYADACWTRGSQAALGAEIPTDPSCPAPGLGVTSIGVLSMIPQSREVVRGQSYRSTTASASLLRRAILTINAPDIGFRCAYDDVP